MSVKVIRFSSTGSATDVSVTGNADTHVHTDKRALVTAVYTATSCDTNLFPYSPPIVGSKINARFRDIVAIELCDIIEK